MQKLIVAATQMSCTADQEQNIVKAEKLVRKAASQNAQIILLQELFRTQYFCQVENPDSFNLASAIEESRTVRHFAAIARELQVLLPISFIEKRNQAHYNSVAVIDADGSILGVYRCYHYHRHWVCEKDNMLYWDRNPDSAARVACRCPLPPGRVPSAPAVTKKPAKRIF